MSGFFYDLLNSTLTTRSASVAENLETFLVGGASAAYFEGREDGDERRSENANSMTI